MAVIEKVGGFSVGVSYFLEGQDSVHVSVSANKNGVSIQFTGSNSDSRVPLEGVQDIIDQLKMAKEWLSKQVKEEVHE